MKRKAVQGSLIHLTVFLGIPVLRSKNLSETLYLLFSIGKQLKKYPYPRSKAAIFKNPEFKIDHSQREKIIFLQNLPGIGINKAISLLDTFGSIDKILTAEVSELEKTKGIGSRLANNIYDLIHTNFKAR
jgi:ERCC4-type nuclease